MPTLLINFRTYFSCSRNISMVTNKQSVGSVATRVSNPIVSHHRCCCAVTFAVASVQAVPPAPVQPGAGPPPGGSLGVSGAVGDVQGTLCSRCLRTSLISVNENHTSISKTSPHNV